ncbi:MAG TPA: DUF1684 domain-containing protein [Acidobacteriaceae bacterium]|nr:DUF1684 domain-containing protein [Acidobacteriaceae bacterium]
MTQGTMFGAAHGRGAASAANSGQMKDEADWRVERARQLSAPDGWLTLVGLEWLKPGKNTVGVAADNSIRLKGHAPEHLAVIEVDGSQLKLLAPAGGFAKDLLVDGQAAHEAALQPDDGSKPSLLSTENLSVVLLHRGDRFALRIKDAQSPTRTGFRGLHWYPAQAKYRLTAKWIPFVPAHTEKIPTVIGTTLDMPAPGLAEFTLDGKTVQIEPVLESPDAKELFFILRDATSHTTTYEAARFLYAEFPSNGLDKPGTIVLDFNRLRNPPCAYTPYATCPLPPYINRLAISIPAGEERYSH